MPVSSRDRSNFALEVPSLALKFHGSGHIEKIGQKIFGIRDKGIPTDQIQHLLAGRPADGGNFFGLQMQISQIHIPLENKIIVKSIVEGDGADAAQLLLSSGKPQLFLQ